MPELKQSETKPIEQVEKIRLVLNVPKLIGGVERKRGFCLLEAVCPKGVTVADIDKAVTRGMVDIEKV